MEEWDGGRGRGVHNVHIKCGAIRLLVERRAVRGVRRAACGARRAASCVLHSAGIEYMRFQHRAGIFAFLPNYRLAATHGLNNDV